MQVTDIRVRQVFDEGKMKARVSVTFDNQFVVHEIKVLDGENGLFIAMPSKKLPTGEYKDIAHPINKETRLMIQELILEAYEQKLAEEEASEE
ncbi:MAG: septation regulator SpoVG [Eubacteriaceae bacterium]|nr:septation regulator SpoVG [Eubacteriaceae bacterium]